MSHYEKSRIAYSIALLIFLSICSCKKKEENRIHEFLDEQQAKIEKGDTVICRNSETITRMSFVNDDKVNNYDKLLNRYGKPDTSFHDTVILPCTSFVYICQPRYLAFHFDSNSKFLGKSWGDVQKGELLRVGSGIEISKD